MSNINAPLDNEELELWTRFIFHTIHNYLPYTETYRPPEGGFKKKEILLLEQAVRNADKFITERRLRL